MFLRNHIFSDPESLDRQKLPEEGMYPDHSQQRRQQVTTQSSAEPQRENFLFFLISLTGQNDYERGDELRSVTFKWCLSAGPPHAAIITASSGVCCVISFLLYFFNPHFHFWSLIFQLALCIFCVLVYCSSLCFLAFVFSLFPFELIFNDCPYCLHLRPFSPSCLHFPDELICINRPVFHLSLCVLGSELVLVGVRVFECNVN